jgi:lipopolysaccharide transport system permease protein
MSSRQRDITLALTDLVDGTRVWRPWYMLGVAELRQRYRRSTLGPLWVTISMGIQALIMGFLLSFLFNIDIGRYLPFLCIGLVTWTYISNGVNDAANCFITQGPVILQVKRPLWTYVMLVLWRNALIYAHTIVIFATAAVVYGIFPTQKYLLIPLGLGLLLVNVGWMALIAAILSARFRDVPLLLQNAFNVLLWLTPVFYHPDQLGPRARTIIELNPLTHILEVARAPFLNEVPPLSTWGIVMAITILGWLAAFALFARCRARVPYWL